ncbi:MAG: HD domain-containing protein [Clostridia bacterium]|nr:HD domain-containing protein [Clostridia bacterium]
MRKILPKNLFDLAENCPNPLYVVGGSVRDHLAKRIPKNGVRDFDLCSPMPAETLVELAQNVGFTVKAVYRNTGTVKLQDQAGVDYEYSCFRSDKYVRGTHVPIQTTFTQDIRLDARRRDFTCNAVYYDIKSDEYLDPLGGVEAIKNERLTTVAPAEKVFSEDGLRLMRLARQAACLGFSPDTDCLAGAKANAALIADISPERIYAELSSILVADEKYGVSGGHYVGLKLLDDTRVLDRILPELTAGRDLKQRPDFHKYDVLEHSLRAVLYADKSVRLAALLHDIGKPLCTLRHGNVHAHPEEGATLTRAVLTRLKAPIKTIEETAKLTALHMYDFNCKTGENKLRRFFAAHYPILEKLLLIKQADFSACTDDLSIAPTCARWEALLARLRKERAPLTLKELALSGKDLLNAGVEPRRISEILQTLLYHTVCNPKDNTKERLIKLALKL